MTRQGLEVFQRGKMDGKKLLSKIYLAISRIDIIKVWKFTVTLDATAG